MLLLRICGVVLLFGLAASAPAQAPSRRPLRANDLYHLRDVSDPQLSPDGKWVAYTVSAMDSAKDKSVSHVWMTSWDGANTIQATTSKQSEHDPRWSPDNRYLAFLSSREGAKETQLWLLDRRGGEAARISTVPAGISDYAWSPDGNRVVLVAEDPDSAESDTTAPPKPIVVTRYHFKNDDEGYLQDRHYHLYLLDVATQKLEQLTSGSFDEESPAWSPDGRSIAFVSNHDADPDRSENSDVFVMAATPGAPARQLTTFRGPDNGDLAWSPDGKRIAYLRGSEPRFSAYSQDRVAIVSVDGGNGAAPRVLTEAFDRPFRSLHWSSDGASILGIVDDDRSRYLARVNPNDGAVQHVVDGQRVVGAFSQSASGEVALLVSTPTEPPEVYAISADTLRRLSHQNDAWLSGVQLAQTEGISAKGKDGTVVDGLLVKPLGFTAGRRYPALLRIHGGPNLQDQYDFHFERQLFAANGYVVFTANYRGSAGRGEAYGTSIFADWGDKEVKDLLAMTDHVAAMDFVDPARLGIGGWSYGGILTDYTIASDNRFKAAIAGAGSALQLSMYGSDEYIVQYEEELGVPWKHQDAWLKVSYPFFHADRIHTPTLFLGGTSDFNVPVIGGEQMYQALRSLGVDTRLIVYPGQHHGIGRPSFKVDRLKRYVAWYDHYLQPQTNAATTAR